MKQHPKLLAFEKFLRRLDGGRKVESEVAQIMADVNKYLRFAHPEGDDPEWLDLLGAEVP